ncbi:YcaO-like family protein, partial [Patescibacteria group bacterium]|nr:YcaO-like family protein [Patescibacteria group bacterium]
GALVVPALNYAVNGKGITSELAKASAYAELAERISCGFFNFFPILSQDNHEQLKSADYFKFYYFSHLKGYVNTEQALMAEGEILAIESIFQKQKLTEKEISLIKDSEVSQHWVDGYSVTRNKKIKVPLRLVHRISGTNGLASGNTIEEAIVHGANEIFERYILHKTVKEKKNLPSINVGSINDLYILRLIKFFYKNKIRVIIKDCSFKGQFPCLGVLFINDNLSHKRNPISKRENGYRWFVEVAFDYREALMRCFTSYIQGVDGVDELKEFSKQDIIWKEWFKKGGVDYEPEDTYRDLSKKNIYTGDLGFLEKGPLINMKDIWSEESDFDFAKNVDQIKLICRSMNTELIVIDQTHPILKFPAVRIVIPGISDEINTEYEKGFNIDRVILPIEKYWPKEFYDFRVSNKWLSVEVEVARFMAEIESHIKSRPSDIYIKTNGLYGRSINLYELLASLFFILGKYDKLKIVLKLLGAFYPDNSEFYKKLGFLIKAQKINEARDYFASAKGCYRFMIERPVKNPLISWCDKPCGDACAKKFEINLRKLIFSFYK